MGNYHLVMEAAHYKFVIYKVNMLDCAINIIVMYQLQCVLYLQVTLI